MLFYVALGIVVITLVAVVYSNLYHRKTNPMSFAVTIAAMLTVYGLTRTAVSIKELEYHNVRRLYSQDLITNGLYTVVGVWALPRGDQLAAIQGVTIKHVDYKARVVNSINIEGSPKLVRLPTPVSTPGTTNFTGYVEVVFENGKTIIRDFDPFKYFPPPPKK